MKKSIVVTSGLALLMGAGVALAVGWNQVSFPPFSEVDANKDGKISMQEAMGHSGTTAAAMKAKPGSTAESAMKSFFSEANQKYKDKPYDSPMTKEDWEGMTGK
ncbi:MAG: EF-hand domain-containing protein [Candidatus Contendobacter sp.]|nr:EF-hand domain-containing protein [Candidatus Contendobacter sp.]MDG4557013.1 EF-hand domain-containing protein [Candidatus Contendobacter sp.]